jgi:hypothetical protein
MFRFRWSGTSRSRLASYRPSIEAMEDRLVLSNFVVTSNADSGPGTLRAAILAVNADPSTAVDVIQFNLPSGQTTIQPLSPLPDVLHAALVDGASQPGFAGTPLVTLFTPHGSGLVFSAATFDANIGARVRSLHIVGGLLGVSRSGTIGSGNPYPCFRIKVTRAVFCYLKTFAPL